MIKNLLFDMGGVIFRQNSEEAYRRFRAMGVNTDDYMGEYGQKGFSWMWKREKSTPASFAGEWLRLPDASLSVGMKRSIAGWALYVMFRWTGFIIC